jgi:hypothetical protein
MNFWQKFGIIPYMKDKVEQCEEVETNLSAEHELSSEEKKFLEETIKDFPVATEDFLGRTHLITHKIDTGNEHPVNKRPYMYSPAIEKKLFLEIDRLLKLGVIRRSKSNWANPLVVVDKKGTSDIRVCLDARFLNKITKKDKYPLANVNRIFGRLKQSQYFSTIDLKDAFFQIGLEEADKEKTAFIVTGRGLFEYQVTPFGLCNSAQSQQRLMDKVLGFEHDGDLFCYLHDIVICSQKFEDHIKLLKFVARRLKEAGLTINKKKFQFCKRSIKYLGFIIDDKGLKIDPEKIAPILNYPQPKTVREVRRLVGASSWFRKFIKNFSTLVAPITDLISNNKKKINWTPEAQEAFEKLKTSLVTAPVLAAPNFTISFSVHCDASDVGLAGVLMQRYADGDKVVAYFSRKLTKSEKNYSTTERECLAVLESVKKFRGYIDATEFEVVTDHASLLWLLNKKDPVGRLGRWALQLQQYSMTLKHRSGREHLVPDALSRAIAEEICSIVTINDVWFNELRAKVEATPDKYPKFALKDGRLYKLMNSKDISFDNWRLVVPQDLRESILKENHDEKAHFGFTKTIKRLKEKYYWPAMHVDVGKYINACDLCKETKAPNTILRPPMGSARIPDIPWSNISIDYKGPFVRSRSGYIYILVVIDNFSKFVLLHPLRKADAKKTIKFLHDEVFLKYSVPNSITSDNGPSFKSKEFANFLESWEIDHQKIPYYHAQGNQAERVMKVIGSAISAYVKEGKHKTWDEKLPEIAAAINTSVHEGHKYTPFEVLFGMKMRLKAEDHTHNISIPVEERWQRIKQTHENVKKNLSKSYLQYKKRYDLRTRVRILRPGQVVFRRNFKLSDATKDYSASLARKFVKCVVDKQVGANRYCLKDLSGKTVGIYDAKDIRT